MLGNESMYETGFDSQIVAINWIVYGHVQLFDMLDCSYVS